MKTATSLFLSALLIVAPMLAVGKRTDGNSAADLEAKCRDGGGCFVVTENGFKKAMLISFSKGYEVAKQECRGSL